MIESHQPIAIRGGDRQLQALISSAAMQCARSLGMRREAAWTRALCGVLVIVTIGFSLTYAASLGTVYNWYSAAKERDATPYELGIVALTAAAVVYWCKIVRRWPASHSVRAEQPLLLLRERLNGDEVLSCEKSIEDYIVDRLPYADSETAIGYLCVLGTIGTMRSLQMTAQMCTGRITPIERPTFEEAVRHAAADCSEQIRRRLAVIERSETLLRPSQTAGHDQLLRAPWADTTVESDRLLRAAQQGEP